MKAIIIGIRPNYVYPGTVEEWSKSNTLYAANLGASLICNSLLRQFDADYIDNFDNIAELKRKYDVCILSLATHLHPNRDISLFVDVIEKLNLKTIVLSAGITDYDEGLSNDYSLHPSVKRLLEIVSSGSEWIGVRGHYSASVLYSHGFKNVVPIGCPSLYWGLNENLKINKKDTFEKPLVPYHLSLSQYCFDFIQDKKLLGQDFQDEVIFTDNLEEDLTLKKWLVDRYSSIEEYETVKNLIRKNGIFIKDFQQWFNFIGEHDFIIGPRLHGCICGLIQGIPTVMTPRDLRVREIVEFFNIPSVTYEQLKARSLTEIYDSLNYTKFNDTYPLRYNNYLKFLEENGLTHNLERKSDLNFIFKINDLVSVHNITHEKIAQLHKKYQHISSQLDELHQEKTSPKFLFLEKIYLLYNNLSKNPLIRGTKRILKK